MAKYLDVQTLIIGLVYLARFLGIVLNGDSSRSAPTMLTMTADQILIWYVTAAVLADKFTNDGTYDDILPMMGAVSQLKVELLRFEESQMLMSMLCHATMFVTPAEFDNALIAVQRRSWRGERKDRPSVLLVIKDILSAGATVTQPQTKRMREPLFSSAGSAIDQVRGMAGCRGPLPSALLNSCFSTSSRRC
jgi:hypothetical protein